VGGERFSAECPLAEDHEATADTRRLHYPHFAGAFRAPISLSALASVSSAN